MDDGRTERPLDRLARQRKLLKSPRAQNARAETRLADHPVLFEHGDRQLGPIVAAAGQADIIEHAAVAHIGKGTWLLDVADSPSRAGDRD